MPKIVDPAGLAPKFSYDPVTRCLRELHPLLGDSLKGIVETMGMATQASIPPRKRRQMDGPTVRPVARLIPAEKVQVTGEVLVLPRRMFVTHNAAA